MPKLMPLILMLFAVAAVYAMMTMRPLKRGLADTVLASNGKPKIALEPASVFKLTGSGIADVAPATRKGQGSARVWFSLYQAPPTQADGQDIPERRLIFLMAEAGNSYTWPVDMASGLHELRPDTTSLGGLATRTATMLLPGDKDPFDDSDAKASWSACNLVRRTTMQANFREMKIIVEYREPCKRGEGLPPEDDVAKLFAFEQRARGAFTVLTPKEATVPEITEHLAPAPASLSRLALAKMLGELEHKTDSR